MSSKFVKAITPLILTLYLSGCGDSGGGSDPTDPGPGSSVMLSGQAFKGQLGNALVSLYEISDGQVGEQIAQVMTDEDGDFNAPLPFLFNQPVKVIISNTDDLSATMLCDYPKGCGQFSVVGSSLDLNNNDYVDFGERFEIKRPFEMSAYIAQQGLANIYVTPITHMAAAKIDQQSEITADSINAVNLELTELFALGTDITKLKPADLTQVDRFNFNTERLFYTIASAAAFHYSPGVTGDSVFSVIDAYYDLFSSINSTEDSISFGPSEALKEFSIIDLSFAIEILASDLVQTHPEIAPQAPTLLVLAEVLRSNILKPIAPPPALKDKISETKSLLADFRNIFNLFNDNLAQLEADIEALEADVEASSRALEPALNDMGQALTDILEIIEDSDNFIGTPPTYENNGLIITQTDEGYTVVGTYGIDGQTQTLDLSYRFIGALDPFSGTVAEPCELTTKDYSIEGTVANPYALATIDSMLIEQRCDKLLQTEVPAPHSTNDSIIYRLSGTVGIEQLQGEAPSDNLVTFTGKLGLNIRSTRLYPTLPEPEEPLSESLEPIDGLYSLNSFSLAGNFVWLDGSTLEASVINQGLAGNIYLNQYEYSSYYYTESYFYFSYNFFSTSYYDYPYGEYLTSATVNITLPEFPKLELSLSDIIIDADGYRAVREYEYSWGGSSKYSFENNNLDVDLNEYAQQKLVFKYEGVDVQIIADVASFKESYTGDRILLLKNRRGYEAVINFSPEKGEPVAGIVGYGKDTGGEIIARIENDNTAGYLVRYVDGSFESLY